ncbi:MAG: hypothetical protein M1833_003096 [Piccolia ochrophora]|nr:MAG: hypothetical protein M1833_003096 [Piccolia ochrophora]
MRLMWWFQGSWRWRRDKSPFQEPAAAVDQFVTTAARVLAGSTELKKSPLIAVVAAPVRLAEVIDTSETDELEDPKEVVIEPPLIVSNAVDEALLVALVGKGVSDAMAELLTVALVGKGVSDAIELLAVALVGNGVSDTTAELLTVALVGNGVSDAIELLAVALVGNGVSDAIAELLTVALVGSEIEVAGLLGSVEMTSVEVATETEADVVAVAFEKLEEAGGVTLLEGATVELTVPIVVDEALPMTSLDIKSPA